MDILQKARELEARLSGRFDRTVGALVGPATREPLEVVHDIVSAAQKEVQSSGRGRRVFPFNRMAVTVLAPSRDVRARYDAVVSSGYTLRDRVIAQLVSAGCAIDADELELVVTYDNKPRKHWRAQEFDIQFDRVTRPRRVVAESTTAAPRLEIAVVNGTAERRSYAMTGVTRVDIGRCAEVRDSRNRLLRTNHVAFLERSGDVNATVSRRHAHISYEPSSQGYRVYDDGSEHGTGIVRQGRSLPVPRGARGVRVETGDEIVLGDARVRIRFGA
jgi:hypothetical protein